MSTKAQEFDELRKLAAHRGYTLTKAAGAYALARNGEHALTAKSMQGVRAFLCSVASVLRTA